MQNNDHNTRLTDLLPDAGDAGFGNALLRLAHMAAALHRADPSLAGGGAGAWEGLTTLEIGTLDKAEQGCQAQTRSARDFTQQSGPVTREGNR